MSRFLFPAVLCFLIIGASSVTAQKMDFKYDATKKNPFGLVNPDAPKEIKDWAPLIGECECISEARKTDGTWLKPAPMIWRFKYIMNGMAVQDETLKPDGIHSGSIRQYDTDSATWYVHYYSNSKPLPAQLPAWKGGKTDDGKIILFKDQTAPNGMKGLYRITFYDIKEEGFKWVGEWTTLDQTTYVYPTWKIDCTKKKKPKS